MFATDPLEFPSHQTIELAPSFVLPVGLVFLSLPLLALNPWVSLGVSLFGVFLLFQTVTLRLRFTDQALDVYRGDRCIRHFPYQDWLHWEIYWPTVPILFYFREVNSIHFVPVLFDPKTLHACLKQRCPVKQVP